MKYFLESDSNNSADGSSLTPFILRHSFVRYRGHCKVTSGKRESQKLCSVSSLILILPFILFFFRSSVLKKKNRPNFVL